MLLGKVFGVNDARARRSDARLKQQPEAWTDKVRVSGCYYRQVDPGSVCPAGEERRGAITATVAWEKLHLRDARRRVGRVHERRGTAVNGVPED